MTKEEFKTLYLADKKRNGKGYVIRYLWLLRKCHCSKGLLNLICRFFWRKMLFKYGLEISWQSRIGKGLYLGHAFNITVNPKAKIGDYCNLHKGVTIGQANRGSKKGAPTIGNRVWIGVNATVIGKVVIGDDVLIAANSFVNCDVPSHSVVFGNPCQIKHRDNATEGYINNIQD